MTVEEAKSLATNGNVEAAMLLGKYYLDQNEHEDAIEWYEIAAKGGVVQAIAVLGHLYMTEGHAKSTKIMRQFCGAEDLLSSYLNAYKWFTKFVSCFNDTITEIVGTTKTEVVKKMNEAAYFAALYSLFCGEHDSALEMISDCYDDRTDILRGIVLLEKDADRYSKKSFELLSKIKGNCVYGEANKVEFEDKAYAIGAVDLSMFYREGWDRKVDLNEALSILKFARGYVKDKDAISTLDAEISHYQPKLFGGYRYVK